jgi:hypothetical protein
MEGLHLLLTKVNSFLIFPSLVVSVSRFHITKIKKFNIYLLIFDIFLS